MSYKKNKESKYNKILHEERLFIEKCMESYKQPQLSLATYKQKNVKDSIQYRQKGNVIYNSKVHDEDIHVKVWRLYSQSIAFARNDSEELALGYGNRSALLFHLEKYEHCIKECDKAIKITTSNFLKSKLLCRKAECLALLNENSAKQVCEEALSNLSELPLSYDLKFNYIDKIQNILKTIQTPKIIEQINIVKKSFKDLTKFKRNKEVPCASTAVAIRYNEQWGRHIAATRDIAPGEIIGIEKVYFRYIDPDGMYLDCSYCAQPAWSSIPCQHCVDEVYCSEKCKSEAWIKYHQFECLIYPYLQEDPNISYFRSLIRFLFITVHDADGIEELKNDLLDIEESKDQRTKGFSSEGIFESDKPKTFYSLKSKNGVSHLTEHAMLESICSIIFVLGTKTNFFRNKITLVSQMLLDDDIKFIGALLLRVLNTFIINSFGYTHTFETQIIPGGGNLKAFGSLFNHNCDPNIGTFFTKNESTIFYAKKPITKGSQLFISYVSGNFLADSKSYRQSICNKFDFTCNCLACIEDWSQICLPLLKTLLEFTPLLYFEVFPVLIDMKEISKVKVEEEMKYNPELMRESANLLKIFVNQLKITCEETDICEDYIEGMLMDYFGASRINDDFNKCSIYKLKN